MADGGGQYGAPPEAPLHLILAQLSRSCGLPAEAVLSRSHEQWVAFVRQLTMYLDRRLSREPYAIIGRHFVRHHTTVMDACRVIEQRLRRSLMLRELMEQIAAAGKRAG